MEFRVVGLEADEAADTMRLGEWKPASRSGEFLWLHPINH